MGRRLAPPDAGRQRSFPSPAKVRSRRFPNDVRPQRPVFLRQGDRARRLLGRLPRAGHGAFPAQPAHRQTRRAARGAPAAPDNAQHLVVRGRRNVLRPLRGHARRGGGCARSDGAHPCGTVRRGAHELPGRPPAERGLAHPGEVPVRQPWRSGEPRGDEPPCRCRRGGLRPGPARALSAAGRLGPRHQAAGVSRAVRWSAAPGSSPGTASPARCRTLPSCPR